MSTRVMKPRPKGKAFKKFPDICGKMDFRALVECARRNGLLVITAWKPDMCCFAHLGLWGTSAAMKKTEAEWLAAGNELKPRNFTAVFGVDMSGKYEDWPEHTMPPVGFVRSEMVIPQDYQRLYGDEPVTDVDLAWNDQWCRWEQPETIGVPASRYRFVIRRVDWKEGR